MEAAGTTVMTGIGDESIETEHSTVMAGDIESSQQSDNQQLAENGEFEKLSEVVNANLSELGMQEDSVEMVGALTKIANAGSPEWRVWACGMLNWHNEMTKFMRGIK